MALVKNSCPDASGTPGDILCSSSSSYLVQELIGEGCFGKVSKCMNLSTQETVAVKILKQSVCDEEIEHEVHMLELISTQNLDQANMIKFFELFEHTQHTCLVFEMLDRDLYDVMKEREWEPLLLAEIRPIAMQLLVALDALRDVGIIHSDIKPDNVVFVNQQDIRVKLNDFGCAILATDVEQGMLLQPIGYRAPEVSLGLPFTQAIDVWGVGCTLAFLYIAGNLFNVDCDYLMLKFMVEILGQPEDRLLCAGQYTPLFFSTVDTTDGPAWRTPEEYRDANSVEPEEWCSDDIISSLDDVINLYASKADYSKDRQAFVDLLKQLLHLDGDRGISPHQALQHTFITMAHLTTPDSRAYRLKSSQLMGSICSGEDSEDRVNQSDREQDPAPGLVDDDTTGCTATSSVWEDDPAPGLVDELNTTGCTAAVSDWEEDPPPSLLDEDNITGCTAAASACSSRRLKPIRGFLRKIWFSVCCCWHPTVED